MEPKIIKSARNLITGLVLRVSGYIVFLTLLIRGAIPSLINLHDDTAAWLAIAGVIATAVVTIWMVADLVLTLNKIDKKD